MCLINSDKLRENNLRKKMKGEIFSFLFRLKRDVYFYVIVKHALCNFSLCFIIEMGDFFSECHVDVFDNLTLI